MLGYKIGKMSVRFSGHGDQVVASRSWDDWQTWEAMPLTFDEMTELRQRIREGDLPGVDKFFETKDHVVTG